LVDVGAAFVAGAEAAVLMEPGEGALDDPTLSTESGSVRCVAPGDERPDAAGAEFLPVQAGVVAAVREEGLRSVSGSSALAAYCWDGVEEREELGDVGAVGGGEQAGERDPLGVGDQVVFAAGAGAVDGVRAGPFAPKSARREEESQTARERSRRSVCRSLARRSWWRRSKTPACCHSWRRRQQVIPEP
jgi:hypothetical protein